MGTTSQKLTYLNETKTQIRKGLNRLGADLTSEDTFRSYATELDEIYDSLPKVENETASESVTLTPTLKAQMQLDLLGNTQQDSTSISGGDEYDSPSPDHPQPIHTCSGDNTIKVEGKNLFDIGTSNADYSGTPSYLTVANNSLSIVIQGGGGTRFYRLQNLVGNNTYTISWVASSGYSRVFVRLRKLDDSGWMTNNDASITGMAYNQYFGGWYANMNNSETGGTFSKTITIPNCLYWQIGLGWDTQTYQGTTQTLSNIMIENGNTMTTYEPYTGQSHLISLGVENLFDKDNITSGYRISATGDNYVASGYYISSFIKVNSNTIYTKNSPTADAYHRVAFYTSNSTSSFISVKDDNNTFTTPSNCQYLRFCGLQTELDTTQLELGSKANSYTPYGTTPIELNKIGTYKDKIYKDNGKWYLHKEIGKVVLDGSENYYEYSISSSIMRYQLRTITDGLEKKPIITNYFKYLGNQPEYSTIGCSFTTRVFFFVNKTDIPTISDLQTWLSTHNTIVYYVLATPTNTEITDSTLLEQLENIYSMTGTTNITQGNNDLAMFIKAKALRGE